MHRIRLPVLMLVLMCAPAVLARQADEVPLVYANRDVLVFRATVAGMTPRERVPASRERLAGLGDAELPGPARGGTAPELEGIWKFLTRSSISSIGIPMPCRPWGACCGPKA